VTLETHPAPKPKSRYVELSRDVVKQCVHCGLCLNYCPTYRVLGNELDSPRGRIRQIRALSEGKISADDPKFREHIYRCLDCRACETVCPSGVDYGRMVEAARAEISAATSTEKATRELFLNRVFTSPTALGALGIATRLYQKTGAQKVVRNTHVLNFLPGPFKKLGAMEAMLPEIPGSVLPKGLPEVVEPTKGQVKHRVALISGCVAQQFFATTNEATIRVLARNGCQVVVPPTQKCCGALHVHAGERDTARQLARHNIAAFERTGAEYYIINAAGCGSTLKEYGELLEDDPIWSERAHAFASKIRDVNEFVATLDFAQGLGRIEKRVTYQDACHLAHGQKIREQPRQIIKAIPGVELVEMSESDFCCGSAGIYNITHGEMAQRLLELKIENVAATKAEMVVAPNPGCIIQIASGVRARGLPMEVIHPIDLLDRAYQLGDAGR
jgi:glycolate oxidase iron-sulfur subunit